MQNRIIPLCRAVLVGWCAAACCGLALAAEQPGSTRAPEREFRGQALQEELRIMSKVLEESLDESGLKDWRSISVGFSTFEPIVRAQYLPTVGAIFTIPVSFPLIEPAPEIPEKEAEADDKESDLWEKHASEQPGHRPPFGGPLPGPFNEKLVVDVKVRDALNLLKHGAHLDDNAPEYDELKVQRLRQALIDALPRYGHRMQLVSDSERILIVVEASPCAPPHGFLGKVNVLAYTQILDEEDKGEDRVQKHLSMVAPRAGGSGVKEHYLIAARKSDLTSETTAEKLEKKIEETRY